MPDDEQQPPEASIVPIRRDESQGDQESSSLPAVPCQEAGPPDPVEIYLRSLAPGSRRTMREALDKAARRMFGASWDSKAGDVHALLNAHTAPWQRLGHQHLQTMRAELAEWYAPATANKILAAIKGVIKECWRLGRIDSETYHRIIDVATVKGQRLMRGRALELGEIRSLAATCKEKKHAEVGMRDAALIAVLYCCGLRRGEAVALELADYDADTGAIAVKKAKGNKQRIVYTSNGSKDALDAWLHERGRSPGPLFCPVNKGGKVDLRAMTEQAVRKILQRRGRDAGVKPFTPHDLRRTCASELWDAGVDGATIQKILGHESQTTTAKYDRRGERAKQEAAKALLFPF